MSSIIKKGRIRSRSILDLSERVHTSELKNIKEEIVEEVTVSRAHPITEWIEKKKEELDNIESIIEEKLENADSKVDRILTEAIEQAEQIKQQAKAQETMIIAEVHRKQEQILKNTENEIEYIKKMALEEKQKMLNAVEGEVVETIITLLQHIVSEELKQNVEWLKMIVRKMLLQEEINEPTTLLISKHNMESLKNEKEELIASLSKLTSIETSDGLNDTTCVLVTKQGNIEYDLNEGLTKVITELRVLKGLSQEQV